MSLNLARSFSVGVGLVLLGLTSHAQRPAALERAGDKALAVEDYYTAIHHFRQALDQDPESVPFKFKLATAAMNFKAYEEAIPLFDQVLESADAGAYPAIPYYLGRCYQAIGDYENAAVAYEQYLLQKSQNSPWITAAQRGLEDSRWAAQQQLNEQLTVKRLFKRINSPYAEFGPWKSGDTLYYTSYRFEKEDDNYQPARKISKVLFSTDERRGRIVGRGFNEDTIHTAHTAITPDQQQIFFSRCQFTEGARISCQLCVRQKDRRRRWSKAFTILPAPVNSPGATSTQPAIFWDRTTNTTYLLFASDREGGSGGMDIWQVPLPREGESWGRPEPLPLNSAKDDLTPFFHAESGQLYFSSQRSPSFGGLDLFVSRWNGQDWEPPTNLGQPLNSSFDDYYPFIVTANEQGYFSSNRPGGQVIDEWSKNCCPDIFRFDAVKTEEVLPEDSTEIVIEPPVIVPEPPADPVKSLRTLEEFLPLALYFDNDEPDRRTRRTSTRKTYTDTYEQYRLREAVYYDQFPDDEEKLAAVENFFSNDVILGFEKLERFSEILLEQLEAGQDVEIFLKGYTSPRAQSDYNLLLGKRRVSSVRNHFQQWREGILDEYIKTGQLIISEVSFGETQAAASARDERAGEQLSIYSADAARERRVEIVEIKRN